jgi:NarL family two-component system response regulator LiaR
LPVENVNTAQGAKLGKSLLIVDDDKTVRNLISGFLAKIPKFTVIGQAVDGEDAVEMAVRLEPDAIILDLVMPKMNGVDAAVRIRQALPQTVIVVFTSHDSTNLRKHIDGNIDAIVSKTEGLEKLARELNRLLFGRALAGKP